MNNRLEPIILQKQREVAQLKARITEQGEYPLAAYLDGKTQRTSSKDFKHALVQPTLSVIAEIKRRSPSRGVLAMIEEPVDLASAYARAGAAAISVLTDECFFGGHLNDLMAISQALKNEKPAILRKDFVIDPIQIAEAASAGADAVLCIVAVLGQRTRTMLEYAKSINMAVLVEVHHQAELDIALAAGAEIIGINNRDLTTFEVNVNTAFQLGEQIPSCIVKVAESGILDPSLAQAYYKAGFNAVLVGEALVTSAHPGQFIEDCCDDKA